MDEGKTDKPWKIIWIVLYLISFFFTDRQNVFTVLSMFAIVEFFPFGKNLEHETCVKGSYSSGFYVVVFVFLEIFFSYYLRLCQRDIFDLGKINVYGITIINSFVVLIELAAVIIYYVWIQKVNLFYMSKNALLLTGLILLPFIFRDSIAACYDVYIVKRQAGMQTCLNFSYRAFILAAFIEEIVYRGMLYDEFKKYFKPFTSGVIQALLFTFMHSERWIALFMGFELSIVINLAVVFCMGVVAAMMREKTRSIVPGIVMHGALNSGIYELIAAALVSCVY